jgi:pimeloyl-ACP methyl ester carboxylesterase
VWAAGRRRPGRWAEAAVGVTHAVAQAGVLDLRAAAERGLGGGAVQAFLGGDPGQVPQAYAVADPTAGVPLDVPVWCVHGRDDTTVPLAQSQAYVGAATAAGARAELVEVPGDHFALIDTTSAAWARTVEVLEGIERA